MTPGAANHAVRLSVAAVFAAFSLGAFAQDLNLDVPYVPTPPDVVEKMLDMAEVDADDRVIDLGSGDGRIAIAAAKRGARAYGVDLDPQRVKEATENAQKEGVADRTTFREQNLFDTNIADADVITMYLLTSVNLELRPRLLDLKPGTRIVSHAFALGSWQPDAEANLNGRKVYFWKVPADVSGDWTFEHNGETLQVALKQDFQKIAGTANLKGVEQAVEGRMDGDIARIQIGSGDQMRTFAGRVNGKALEPVTDGRAATDGGTAGAWTARRV